MGNFNEQLERCKDSNDPNYDDINSDFLSSSCGTVSVTRLGDLLDFGYFLNTLATINLPKSPTFLGNFCKGVKTFHFSSEIIFGQLLLTFGVFFWSHWAQLTDGGGHPLPEDPLGNLLRL